MTRRFPKGTLPVLLSNALDEFLTVRSTRLNPRSLAQYEWELDRFVQHCTASNVTDTGQLSPATVATYLAALREHPTSKGRAMSSRSLLHYAKDLRVFLKWLVDQELTPARALKWEMPKAEVKVPPTLTPAQEKQLLAACGESDGPALQARDTAIVLLLMDTGMRVSELCGLKLSYVKLDDDPHVLVFGKGSKYREIGPLGKRTVRALKAYRNVWRERQHPKDGVDTFFMNRYGTAMQPITVERLLERLKERTGIDARVNPHTWRHSWARARATEGTDVLVISRLMGHTDVKTTGLYLGQFQSADARRQVKSIVDSL